MIPSFLQTSGTVVPDSASLRAKAISYSVNLFLMGLPAAFPEAGIYPKN